MPRPACHDLQLLATTCKPPACHDLQASTCLPRLANLLPATTCNALLVLEHNEVGFSSKDVRSLCDIAQSTKDPSIRKFIGAKGIGFKSVFRATETPVVHSGKYHFHFDAAALGGLGYLIPFPLSCPRSVDPTHGTRLVLPLPESRHAAEHLRFALTNESRSERADIPPLR